MGLNAKSLKVILSLCVLKVYQLLCETEDEVWNFFKKLACDTYEFEQVKGTLGYPTHVQYDFHVNHPTKIA